MLYIFNFFCVLLYFEALLFKVKCCNQHNLMFGQYEDPSKSIKIFVIFSSVGILLN